jgi:hypothetical protein
MEQARGGRSIVEARTAAPGTSPEAYPLGTGRPPLKVDDLPEPEQVFGVPRIGAKALITLVIGPS